jgi:hypothetical protein
MHSFGPPGTLWHRIDDVDRAAHIAFKRDENAAPAAEYPTPAPFMPASGL